MKLLLAAVVLLAGCSSVPTIDTGAIACVRVDALTAQTTTVYIAAGVVGSVVVQPDCSIGAQLLQKGVAL